MGKILVEQKVKVRWNSSSKKYYEGLGYNYTKMGDLFEIDVLHLKKGSDVKVEFVCDYCNGSNQLDEESRHKRYADYNKYRKLTGKDCCNHQDCKRRKLSEAQFLISVDNSNSLRKNFPKIAEEWHPTKNGDLTPDDYAMKSNREVWWLCPKGHEWKKRICDRTGELKVNCPYCSGYKVCDDNSLHFKRPELSKQWHSIKNGKLTPHDITCGSNKIVWWICEHGHEWDASVASRAGNMKAGCPICLETSGEQRVRKYLESLSTEIVPQKSFGELLGVGGGRLVYDFYLPEFNLLIEYQGEFHDENIKRERVQRYIKTQKEHDKRKRDFAKSKSIDLLEIWYWDYDNIEKILDEYFRD